MPGPHPCQQREDLPARLAQEGWQAPQSRRSSGSVRKVKGEGVLPQAAAFWGLWLGSASHLLLLSACPILPAHKERLDNGMPAGAGVRSILLSFLQGQPQIRQWPWRETGSSKSANDQV